jgi:hypothetical protein
MVSRVQLMHTVMCHGVGRNQEQKQSGNTTFGPSLQGVRATKTAPRLLAWVALALIACICPTVAGAQQTVTTGGFCYVPDVAQGQFPQPVDCLPAPPTWFGAADPTSGLSEGSLTLERMARLNAPILWFSPREFLLLERKDLDAPGRILEAGTERTVYYRIREIWLRDAAGQTPLDRKDPRIPKVASVWGKAAGELPIGQLDRVFIQYFFYYPEDRGIGGHFDDLEALEIQVELRRLCRVLATPSSGQLKGTPAAPCAPAVTVRTVSGSAHGVGWYTNTLDVTATRDTVLPMAVLVEENKHASVPDRDGDGKYMPYYDVNRQSNDAWGVRDVAGSGHLGGPVFRAELARERSPEGQVCPPEILPRLREQYERDKRAAIKTDCVSANRSYTMAPSSESRACPGHPNPLQPSSKLRSMMADKDFCDPPGRTRVVGPRNLFGTAVRSTLRRISPGPNGEYGFQNAVQRLSFAYRYDGGNGVSAILPIGTEVPVVGGWAIVKLNAIFDGLDSFLPPVTRGSVETLYAPSASRAIDWYGSVGAESVRSAPEAEHDWRSIGELGLRFRFSAEKLKVIRFLGGRVGLRAELSSPIHNARLVFEFGAGSW